MSMSMNKLSNKITTLRERHTRRTKKYRTSVRFNKQHGRTHAYTYKQVIGE